MKHTIQKISKLIHAESFLQINLVKGFKYVDKAGEIVNEFHYDNKEPQFAMNLNELVIRKSGKEEIKISPKVFWSHYTSPDSFNQFLELFIKDAEKFFKILEVDQISRIGWRNHFVYEFSQEDGEKERDLVFSKFLKKGKLNLEVIEFSNKIENVNFYFRISKVSKNDKESTPALLFDVDCFREFKNYLEIEKIQSELKEIEKEIKSEEFLTTINFILQIDAR